MTRQEEDAIVRAAWWDDPALADVPPDGPAVRLVAIRDPRWTEPPVLATPLPVSARALRDRCLDRRPVEQLPLAAKQMLASVSAPETCRRRPELALLAGSILTHLAATLPAVPTGSRDRRPRPTPGRLRRRLAHADLPASFPLPDHIRQRAAGPAHLPTGFWGQRHSSAPSPAPSSTADPRTDSAAVA